MNGWARINVVIKIRLRIIGSCSKWFWLAISMRGSNQQDRTSSGVEIWSIEVQGVSPLFG